MVSTADLPVGEWALKQAMVTIQNAAPTRKTDSAVPMDQGRATWLRSLDPDGKAFVGGVVCPLSRVPTTLKGKDWTRYEGVLHTDHAVREEFFLDRESRADSFETVPHGLYVSV